MSNYMPQLIVLIWWTGYIICNFTKQGQPIPMKANGFRALFNVAVSAAVLWWGGFWK